MLTQQDFIDGGAMYWRVAVVDPDGNVGAFSKAKKFTLLARMQVHDRAASRRTGSAARWSSPSLNAKGKPIKGVAVKLARRRRQDGDAQDEQEGRRDVLDQADQDGQPHRHRDQEALQGRHGGRADRVVPAGCRAARPGTPVWPAPATMAAVSAPETAETEAETRGDEIRTADLVATALTRYAQAFATFGLMALVAAAFPALVVVALARRRRATPR